MSQSMSLSMSGLPRSQLRQGWEATRSPVSVVGVVVDVEFCLVADSDNDIDHDGHSRLLSSSVTLSDAPIDEEFDIDDDCDCDTDLTVQPIHGQISLPGRLYGARTEQFRKGRKMWARRTARARGRPCL